VGAVAERRLVGVAVAPLERVRRRVVLDTGDEMEGRGTLRLESGVAPEVVNALIDRGHAVDAGAGGYGGYQAIMWNAENGVYWGGTEMREDGTVVGY
jgi:gamma-glutamyltranspeptidase / glutathione hydrolase